MKRLEMSLLRLEFLSYYDVVPASKFKKKNRPIAGRAIVQCREYEFLFGGGASGYCVMTFEELEVLRKWRIDRFKPHASADNLARQNVKKLVAMRKEFRKKGGKI